MNLIINIRKRLNENRKVPKKVVVLSLLVILLPSLILFIFDKHIAFDENKIKSVLGLKTQNPTNSIQFKQCNINGEIELVTEETCQDMTKNQVMSQTQEEISTPMPKAVSAKSVSTDPIIKCTSTYPNCAGQSIELKQSACSSIICCQIGEKWSIYPSKDQCTKDQSASIKQTQTVGIKTSSNPNEVTCNVIGYSQSRNVWTYILTPSECDSARASQNSPQHTTSPTDTLTDCTIDGQVVGKMNHEECSQKITEYYRSKTPPIRDTSTEDYNKAVRDCLNRMRALGILDSSAAQECYTNTNLGR